MELIQYRPEDPQPELAAKIIALEETAWPREPGDPSFPSAPDTYVTSFVWMEQDTALCHVGIRKSLLRHSGQDYLAYGLSEVVTHPAHRGKGLATRAIGAAARFIAAQGPDISIFTCAPERVHFYTRCGWKAIPGARLVGGTVEKPFPSTSLGLITMMLFLSPKGRQHARDFEHTDIFLPLGENQLW